MSKHWNPDVGRWIYLKQFYLYSIPVGKITKKQSEGVRFKKSSLKECVFIN